MLDLGDLLTLIRLTEIEIFELQKEINGEDEVEQNNAGEIIVQIDSLSVKLSSMYETKWNEDCGYPSYEKYIHRIKSYPPFTDKNNRV